jgi:flagella basal body P-ring formation protein FlgA
MKALGLMHVLAGAGAVFAVGVGPALGAVHIKPRVSVDGPFVTIGDVFDGAGAIADHRIAPSPAPGRTLVLSTAALAEPVRDLGLDPAVAASEVVVTRTGTTVGAAAIEGAIGDALQAQAGGDKLSIYLSNQRLEMVAPAAWSGALHVDNVNYDDRSGRFTATVSVPGGDAAAQGVEVTGRADRIVSIPVLSRPIATGEIIGQADLGTQDVPAARVASNVVRDAAGLIGQAARRPLAPDHPLRLSDIQKPVVVQKGSLVSMVVQAPGMVLTAIGRALQDGGQGDAIQLTNPQTKRTLQGIVTGPGAVKIATRGQVLGAL